MEYVDRITRRSENQSSPACPVFPKHFDNTTRDEADLADHEIEEEIQEEQENTRSFVAEITKWETMRQAGQKLSESALTAGTIKSYENLWKQFLKYCEGFGDKHLQNVKLLEQDTPSHIVCWVMETCESEGSADLSDTKGRTYSHALKMRAAVSWGFAYKMGIGSNEPWLRTKSGEYQGNPSISHEVGRYMVSLNRRKVQAGEVPTSARSIVEKDMLDFYEKNNGMEFKDWNPEYRNLDDISNWGGPLQRLMMQAIYIISFICLLRFDEVLKIQHHHIQIIDMDQYHVRLTLPFRKTHQYGEIKPFDLWPNTKKRHLDPVHALLKWIHRSNIRSGYIFRKITLNDQVSQLDKPLNSDTFLESFRRNLLEIGRSPLPYGTHSFRRGGCQYLSSVEGWPIRKLCDWGGWSTSFSNLTIVRYLINWNDDPGNTREDFFKPAELRVRRCKECGQPV